MRMAPLRWIACMTAVLYQCMAKSLANNLRARDTDSSQSHHEPDELQEAELEKNSSALFTTETRSTRRRTENPDASVKSSCPPCLRGETGRLAAAGLLSESRSLEFIGAIGAHWSIWTSDFGPL